MPNGYKIFSGNGNRQLAEDICSNLGVPLGKCKIKQFADGELHVQYEDNIRGCDVFIVQPTCAPVNTNLMELMLMANAAVLASARSVTAVMPYFGYARQDRKDKPRVALSAQVVAGMLQSVAIDRVLGLDLHSAPIQGMFNNMPFDHLYALPVLIEYFKKNKVITDNLCIVTPDVGGLARAKQLANYLGLPYAVCDKTRIGANELSDKPMTVIGDVKGKRCLLVDDMIDTAQTLVKAADALMLAGAVCVAAFATHGILSETQAQSAVQLIEDSCIEKVIVTDSIPQEDHLITARVHTGESSNKIEVLTVAPLIAKAINAIYTDGSISNLFIS